MLTDRLPDTPFWALFRLELRRCWPPRGRRLALRIFVWVLLLQAAISVAGYQTMGRSAGSTWASIGLSALGANFAVFLWYLSRGHVGVPTAHLLAYAVGVVPGAATHYLMPGWLALALAPEPGRSKIGDLRLAGYRPGLVLLATGLAAVLPFFLLTAVGWAATAGAILVSGTDQPLVRAEESGSLLAQLLLTLSTQVASFAASATTLAALAALCRSRAGALAACYAMEFIGFRAIGILGPLALSYLGGGMNRFFACYRYLPTAAEAILALALVPLACRALQRPDR